MNIRSQLLSFLWLAPFVGFWSGYLVLKFFLHTDVLHAPSVVGQHLQDAIKNLSAVKLNVRILSEKEDNDLPEGVVLSQSPSAGQKIKAHQSVYVVVTRKKLPPQVPSYYHKHMSEAEGSARQLGVTVAAHGLHTGAPTGTVLAQSLLPGQMYAGQDLIIYTSRGTTPLRVMPRVKGRTLAEVQAFFDSYDLACSIINPQEVESSSAIIIDQRPFEGSLIDLTKPPLIQLKIS